MQLRIRKNVVMAILERMGGCVTAKCMQKYLFVFSRTYREDCIYDFVPYKYGCFSFQANQDLNALERDGYIAITENDNKERSYSMLHKVDAYMMLDMFMAAAIDKICDELGNMSQDELIAYTYRKWPATAVNSVIKEKLLDKAELARVDRYANMYKKDERELMTIGYEGFTLEAYLRRLMSNDVRVLVDVRKNAFSMKFGFSKAILEKACAGVGIKYIHMPQLGIESSKRTQLVTQADYDALFGDYEKTTLKENWKYLLNLAEVVRESGRVCLTCFEKDPAQCHRTRVANALMGLDDLNVKYSPLYL